MRAAAQPSAAWSAKSLQLRKEIASLHRIARFLQEIAAFSKKRDPVGPLFFFSLLIEGHIEREELQAPLFLWLIDFHDRRVVFQQGLRLARAREFNHERIAVDLEHFAAAERFMVDGITGRERIVHRLFLASRCRPGCGRSAPTAFGRIRGNLAAARSTRTKRPRRAR